MPPLLLIFVVFYFMLIRPQSKRKEHRAMLAALEVGTEVATAGGIIGRSPNSVTICDGGNCVAYL
jgi:preprotein translocase subunit YajC